MILKYEFRPWAGAVGVELAKSEKITSPLGSGRIIFLSHEKEAQELCCFGKSRSEISAPIFRQRGRVSFLPRGVEHTDLLQLCTIVCMVV